MLALLVAAVLVTGMSTSVVDIVVDIMNADMTDASLEYAVSRSFYIAQAGLEEAKALIRAAPDPTTATPLHHSVHVRGK